MWFWAKYVYSRYPNNPEVAVQLGEFSNKILKKAEDYYWGWTGSTKAIKKATNLLRITREKHVNAWRNS